MISLPNANPCWFNNTQHILARISLGDMLAFSSFWIHDEWPQRQLLRAVKTKKNKVNMKNNEHICKKHIYIRFNLRLCHLPRCTLYCSNILALRSPTSRQPCAAMNRAFFRGVLKEVGPSSSTIHTRYPLLMYVVYVLVISSCVSIFMYVITFQYTFMFILICCVCVLIKHMHIFLYMCMCIYIYICICVLLHL